MISKTHLCFVQLSAYIDPLPPVEGSEPVRSACVPLLLSS